MVKGKLIYEGLGCQSPNASLTLAELKDLTIQALATGWLPRKSEKMSRASLRKLNIDRLRKWKNPLVSSLKKLICAKWKSPSKWSVGPAAKPGGTALGMTFQPPTKTKRKQQTMQLFEAGRKYILDELADDIISERAAKCLDYAADNALYCLLAGFLAGTSKPSRRTPLVKEHAKAFLGWVEHTKLPPKPEQAVS